jgi:hypothetical protein
MGFAPLRVALRDTPADARAGTRRRDSLIKISAVAVNESRLANVLNCSANRGGMKEDDS